MKTLLSVLACMSVFLLSGCTVIPIADQDIQIAAKSFTPKKDRANIYVYQEDSSVLIGNFPSKVIFDGIAVGTIKNLNFFLFEVPPGTYSVATERPNGLANGSKPVEISTESGGNYFVRNEYDVGLLVHFKLAQISDRAGRADITGSSAVVMPEHVTQQIAAKSALADRQRQLAAAKQNLPSPKSIVAPRPIAGSSGPYKSPYTAAGGLALWAQKPVATTDNGSDLAAGVGGAAAQHLANKALDFVPFGLGGLVSQKAGESAARAATRKTIEPELPAMETVAASSDLSFDSADKLAVYLYAKHSQHPQYERVLALAQRIYPDLQDAYVPAIETASRQSEPKIEKASRQPEAKKEKSADERLEALLKLKKKGLITDADYQARKKQILESL